MKGDLFRGIVQTEIRDRHGNPARLPVFYQDVASIAAVFTASTRLVCPLLPHPDLHPVQLLPGVCLVGFTAFEYRACDIDPYNELSIAFPVTFGRPSLPAIDLVASLLRRDFRGYVWQLPVTTERAREGGVDLYGYPKFLADIRFRESAGWTECTVGADGEEILALRVRQGPTRPGRLTRYRTISMRQGVPLFTNVLQLPHEFHETLDRGAATLEVAGRHPVCAQLASLGLGARPLLAQSIPSCETVLFAPRNRIDD